MAIQEPEAEPIDASQFEAEFELAEEIPDLEPYAIPAGVNASEVAPGLESEIIPLTLPNVAHQAMKNPVGKAAAAVAVATVITFSLKAAGIRRKPQPQGEAWRPLDLDNKS